MVESADSRRCHEFTGSTKSLLACGFGVRRPVSRRPHGDDGRAPAVEVERVRDLVPIDQHEQPRIALELTAGELAGFQSGIDDSENPVPHRTGHLRLALELRHGVDGEDYVSHPPLRCGGAREERHPSQMKGL